MRKIILLIIVLLSLSNIKAQDVQLIVPKLSIDNSIKTLIDARAASFSSYTPGFGVDMWNVKLIYSSSHPLILNLIPPNRFRIQCGIVGRANINYLAGNFEINGEGDITIEGVMSVEGSQGQLTLLGSADAVIQVSGVPGFVLNLINSNEFILRLPDFELASFVFTLPSIPQGYFTTNYPTISITNDNVILGLQTPSNFLIVDQKDQSGNRIIGSSISLWENNMFVNYTVPAIFSNLPINSWQTFRGEQGFQLSPFQKYNNWNNLSEVENHKKFYLTGNLSRLNSNFKQPFSGITIKNNLESSGIDGGSIEFADPWLIDYPDPLFGNTKRNRGMKQTGDDALIFKTRTSSFYPDYSTNYNGDVYNGVFLNQQIESGKPYYSVGAPLTQEINVGGGLGTHKFYFQNWTGTDVSFQDANANQTGVVFTSSNAVVTANLKGNLLSNSPGGISTNSQRKIVRTDNGYYHLVYESLGNVYYTHSLTTDFYGDWTREELLMTNATNPSLDYVGNDVYIVYEIYDTDYSNQPVVHLLKLLYDNSTWFLGWYTDVAYNEVSNLGYAKPVVYARSDEVFVIAKLSANEKLKYTYIIDPGNPSSQWSTPADLPGTYQYSVNPTLAGGKLNNDDYLHISYEGKDRIYYLFSYRAGSQRRFNTPVDISSGSSYSINKYPSISLVNDQFYPIVTWRGAYKTIVAEERMSKENAWMIWVYKTVVRVKSSLGWGTFSAFGNKVDYPNINSIETNDETIIAWTENQGQYAKYVKRAKLQANTTFKQQRYLCAAKQWN